MTRQRKSVALEYEIAYFDGVFVKNWASNKIIRYTTLHYTLRLIKWDHKKKYGGIPLIIYSHQAVNLLMNCFRFTSNFFWTNIYSNRNSSQSFSKYESCRFDDFDSWNVSNYRCLKYPISASSNPNHTPSLFRISSCQGRQKCCRSVCNFKVKTRFM